MSEQRTTEIGDTLAQDKPEDRSAKKARIAAVLDRGITTYNLRTDYLPNSLAYQWAPYSNDNEMSRLSLLGFEVYTPEKHGTFEGAPKPREDGTIRVGDVVLMVTPKENKELIDEVYRELVNSIHNPSKEQIEERQFKNSMQHGVKPIVESKTERVDGNAIAAAINQGR